MNLRDSIAAARISGPIPSDGSALPTDAPVFEFIFQRNDPVFTGHFPERPVVPGIFQLEITRLAAEWSRGRPLALREILRAKFQRPVLPGETLTLNLNLAGTGPEIIARANFSCGGQAAGEAFLKLWHDE
jgi:3-hydroxyacyl-[acyl-carrier-protein] dehydratase